MNQLGSTQVNVSPTGNLPCPYCGPNTYHIGVCPRVLSIEYYPNGTTKKVTFREPVNTDVQVFPQPN